MKDIKLVVLDVDGTLTDGKIYIDNNGVESKAFHVKDGMAIVQAIKHGIEILIITGKKSRIVEIRAKELGIKEIHQGIHHKDEMLKELLEKRNMELHEVGYVGDDINDLKIMTMVGFSACPSDAAVEIKQIANYISNFKGGEGAVREILRYILEEKGIWEDIIQNYKGVNQ